MVKEYAPFAISNFRTGFNESLEPWLLPRDAFQSMINAHLYRGVLEKIEGYSLFAKMTYRSSVALTATGNPNVYTGTLTSGFVPASTGFYAYGVVSIGVSAETFTYDSDASSTVINLVGSNGGSGTVNLTTRAVSITFGVAPTPNAFSSFFISWDRVPLNQRPIMGIKQYFDSSGSQEVLIFDTIRVGVIQENFGVIASNFALQYAQEVPHDYYQSAVFTGNGVTTVFTGTLAASFIQPGQVQLNQFTSLGVPVAANITDNGFGALQGTNVNSAASFINYNTGAYQVTFTVAPASGNYFDSITGVFGNVFTGNLSNFFTLSNYQYKAFFTNSIDPVMYYDGTAIHYLNTNFVATPVLSNAGVPTNYSILRCLHLTVNQNRLLLLSPTLELDGLLQNSIYWSAIFDPFNWSGEENLPAPTSEPIRCFGYINTDLVVRFASSERVFRYTADAFSPFRWDSTNLNWECDAPYSDINYDTWYSSVGKPGIVGSDGVNVKRADESIPDFTDPSRLALQLPVPYINQTSIKQCYGERFDDIKEGWLCYNSAPQDQSSITASDNVLAFNYLDSTYAVYKFPLSCLGFGRIINVPTWGTITTAWGSMSDTWDSYQIQSNALVDLGGDQFGNVFALNSGNTQTVAGDDTVTPVPVLMSVVTKSFNPFVEAGQLARFGYLDLFVSANNTTTLRVQFYINDQLYVDGDSEPAGYWKETTLTFTDVDQMSPNTPQTKVWKRIYLGVVGKSHTIRFYQNIEDFTETDAQPVYIHAMVLYMKPAGTFF